MEPDCSSSNTITKPKVSLQETAESISALACMPLPPHQQPDILASTHTIHYAFNTDTRFADRQGYVLDIVKFSREAETQAQLVALLEEGQSYETLLYTWRCCSRSIPAIKGMDQPNRREIYEMTIDVLEPQINKLRQFLHFQKRAMERFSQEVQHLCHPDRHGEFISKGFLLTLGKLVNMFATLDELKNIKASIKNDYSAYRRAAEISKKNVDATSIPETQELSMFLGTHNNIRSQLKQQLSKIADHEDLMADIVNACLQDLEQKTYLLPEEKYSLYKIIGFGLFLMDSQEVNINKLDGRKKINLNKIDKFFKNVEVVPLYGDMMMSPFSFIQNTPNFEESKWPHCTDEKPGTQKDIISSISQIQSQHDKLLCDIALHLGIRKTFGDVLKGKSDKLLEDENCELYNLTLHCLQCLSSWTSRVMELFSWKLAHPTDYLDNPECPRDAEEYERATKYNFNKDEKDALIQVISYIKDVQAIVMQAECRLTCAIHSHIYNQLQEFIQVTLREPIRKACKKKKSENLRNVLLSIRDLCSDWAVGISPQQDPILSGKKDAESGYKVALNHRTTPPGTTQLYLLRTMLESVVEKTSGKKSLRKEMESQYIQAIENFLKVSFYWPYLINLSSSLHLCCDLSQLWYREFYLEMTQGRRIQFPIEMSMPWILTDYILETKNPATMNCILYMLDLYNDSAMCALKYFRKKFLYDEVEAEVNLCFDQLVYKLSDQVFAYYKHLAGSIFLDKNFQWTCRKLGLKINQPPLAEYENILHQQQVQLLGRSINIRKLISQRMNAAILKSLDVAISRFETGNITGIMELEGLIQLNRLTHQLLSKHLELADFNHLLQEANHKVNEPCGRITLYLFFEINYDFLRHYCYNASTNRFVRTTFELGESLERDKPINVGHDYLWGTKSLGVCFSAIYNQYSQFVGAPHFSAICRLLGYNDIAVIMKELLTVIINLAKNTIIPYTKALMEVMPKRLIMPRFEYGSPGILAYYQTQLNDIMMYSDLQPKVFQSLREIGNAILITLCISQALSQEEVIELKHANIFLNVIPKPFVQGKDKKKEEREAEVKRLTKQLEAKYRYQHLVPVITNNGTSEQIGLVKEHSVITREKLCCGLSIFEVVLSKIKAALTEEEWTGAQSDTSSLSVGDSKEFHRLWSALQFVFCIPPRSEHEFTVEQLFGEGLNWAGCTLILLLGQQRRFEIMDFSYHLLKVNRIDQKDDVIKGVSLKKMMDRIRKFQILNNQIFSILDKYLSYNKDHEPPVIDIAPPSPDLVTGSDFPSPRASVMLENSVVGSDA